LPIGVELGLEVSPPEGILINELGPSAYSDLLLFVLEHPIRIQEL
jgi:hypothetical protein